MDQVSILKKELSLPKLLTVSKLSYLIKLKLEGVPTFQNVHVVGEVSDLRKKDTIYFTLKDNKSVIKCVFFDPDIEFELENGLEVVVFGNVSSYSQNSSYQLVISSIIPVGEGAQALKLKQLKEKLRKEGLFDSNKPLPILPQRIGLVTAKDSAAYGDVIKTIKQRYPYLYLIVKFATVQGDNAVTEIINGINLLDKQDLDVILITRGGGGSTDLDTFNNETLARTIYDTNTPVVTAIGHNKDLHIADMVADAFFITPTAAINELLPSAVEYRERIAELQGTLSLTAEKYYYDLKKEKERKILYIVIGVLFAVLIIVLGLLL